MTSAQGQWWRRLHNWADVIHVDFQTVISRVQQNISTYPFCTAERMLRTVIMQNSRLIQACFPIKIDEVWIGRFCVRYDWWRRLQWTSSVSPVWGLGSIQFRNWNCSSIPIPIPELELELKLVELKMELELKPLELELELELKTGIEYFATATTALNS